MHLSLLTQSLLICGLLITNAPRLAAVGREGDADRKEEKKSEKKQKEEERRRQQEQKASARQERQYEKLKQFALQLYDNELDFREAVDRDYENVMREHSEMAFNTNLSRRAVTVAIQEDRFRRHFYLYDNLAAQYYVNAVAQRLAPKDSDRLFAVRLTPSPIPSANTLATGTIYISTGLVALLESESQLAYVLAHEMAHVTKDHWKLKSIMKLAEPEYNAKQAAKATWISALFAGAGAGIGAAASRSSSGAATGALIGLAAGAVVGTILNPSMNVDFDKVQEDEADREAFRLLLNASYDVGEIPRLYLALQGASNIDSRAALGFIGNRRRIRERIENCRDLIEKAYKAEIELKKSKGELVGDNPQFRHVMAELKRDNGIMAYYYDMFAMARNNLSEAVALRSNDPTAQYFYGKVLQLVGRTPEEMRAAREAFRLAAQHDTRGQNFGAHLHQALGMMGDLSSVDTRQVIEELQAYVNSYLRHADFMIRGASLLPPNLESVYDYLTMLGESKWTPQLPEGAGLLTLVTRQADQQPAASAEPAPSVQPEASAPKVVPAANTPTTGAKAKPARAPAGQRK